MKKLISTLFASVAFIGFMKAQVITDFETATAPTTIYNWGGKPSTVVADPQAASNHVLKYERDSDVTFSQTVILKIPAVTITAGNTSFKVAIKGNATRGGWLYVKLWNHVANKEIGEAWVGGSGADTIKSATVFTDLSAAGKIAAGDVIDSIMINVGNWSGTNNNAPGYNGTYYIDSIVAFAPPGNVYLPHKLINRIAYAWPLEDDSITFDGVANENTWLNDTLVYDVNDGGSDTTFGQASFQVAYDAKYLYYFVTVKKPTPHAYDEVGGNAWKEDGIQLYFDQKFNPIVGGIAKNQVQLTLPLKAKYYADFSPYAGNSVSPGDSIYTASDTTKTRITGTYAYHKDLISGNKYFQEIRVPLASLYWDGVTNNSWAKCLAAFNAKPLVKGDSIGFDFQVNIAKADNSGRDGVNIWSQNNMDSIKINGKLYTNSLGSYQNSGQWGALVLGIPVKSGVKTLSSSAVKLYPNPSVSIINVEAKNMQQISVFNTVGQVVIFKNVTSDKDFVNVANLVKGIYLIQVKTLDGVINKKIVKN